MPLKEPAPEVGTAEQPAPKVWEAALVLSPVAAVPELLLEPQAARPMVDDSAIAAIPVRRSVVFMVAFRSFLGWFVYWW
jgi:hypothetical protein